MAFAGRRAAPMDPEPETTGRKSAPGKFPRVVTWAAIVAVIAAVHLARPVLIPLALAILFSFLLAPVARRLELWRLGRIPGVLVTVLGAMALALTMGWFVLAQMHELAAKMPEYRGTLHARFAEVRERFGGSVDRAAEIVEEIEGNLEPGGDAPPAPDAVRVQVVDEPGAATTWMRGALGRVAEILGVGALVALLVIFMLLQREALRDRLIWVLGHQRLHVKTQMLEEASRRVSRYLQAQLIVNGTQGLLVGLGLAWIGVPNALLWGLLSALLRFLPYVGPWIAALCPILISFAVFDGWTRPLETIALFVVLETLSNNLLEPWLYGARTGMSSLAIVVAATFWTFLWGGVGLVLATPLTVCLVVMGKHIPQLRALAVLLGDQPVLSSAARLYQRLLAGDLAGARAMLAAELESKPLLEAYDATVLPALALAAEDGRTGLLEDERREAVEHGLQELVEEAGRRPEEPVDPPVAAPATSPKVLCLPASDAIDEIAARMLCDVLGRDGVPCEVASVVLFAGEMLELVEERGADVVCVSHMQPPALAPTRYLCKRLIERYPNVPVVVGAWTVDPDAPRGRLRLPRDGEFHVATSLAEARTHALRLVEDLRAKQRATAAPKRRSRSI